jgi:Methionine synthase I (cobalamin-dependent), methyltransferase domain
MRERPDLVFLETFIGIEILKIAADVAGRYEVPLFCSMTFRETGRTMMGDYLKDMLEGLRAFPVHAVGLNCSLGPHAAQPVLSEFRRSTDLPLLFKPSAGKTRYENCSVSAEFYAGTFVSDVLPAV